MSTETPPPPPSPSGPPNDDTGQYTTTPEKRDPKEDRDFREATSFARLLLQTYKVLSIESDWFTDISLGELIQLHDRSLGLEKTDAYPVDRFYTPSSPKGSSSRKGPSLVSMLIDDIQAHRNEDRWVNFPPGNKITISLANGKKISFTEIIATIDVAS